MKKKKYIYKNTYLGPKQRLSCRLGPIPGPLSLPGGVVGVGLSGSIGPGKSNRWVIDQGLSAWQYDNSWWGSRSNNDSSVYLAYSMRPPCLVMIM